MAGLKRMSKNGKLGKPYFGKRDFENTEAQVKSWVKDVLNKYNVYFHMHVPFGYGKKTVDFHCVVDWCGIPLAFFIETKKFGEEPTAAQALFIKDRKEQQKARTFVIDGMVGVRQLEEWLIKLEQTKVKLWAS